MTAHNHTMYEYSEIYNFNILIKNYLIIYCWTFKALPVFMIINNAVMYTKNIKPYLFSISTSLFL